MSLSYLSAKGMELVFKQWAETDPNIQSNGYGQLYNQNGEPKVEQKYPGVWVNPVSTSVDEWVITRSYQILIYDLPFDNENDVISDCEEWAFRLIRFLKKADEVFNVVLTPTIQPFNDRFFDDVSGVILNVDIEFNAQSSDCLDPQYVFDIIKNNIN
jgi:hypothetical protein